MVSWGGKRPSAAELRRRNRVRGYADGLAGRRASDADAEYQVAWRRGRERRDELAREGRES